MAYLDFCAVCTAFFNQRCKHIIDEHIQIAYALLLHKDLQSFGRAKNDVLAFIVLLIPQRCAQHCALLAHCVL